MAEITESTLVDLKCEKEIHNSSASLTDIIHTSVEIRIPLQDHKESSISKSPIVVNSVEEKGLEVEPKRYENNFTPINGPETPRTRKRKTCGSCGEVGHNSRTCPENYCSYCVQDGHKLRDCTLAKEENRHIKRQKQEASSRRCRTWTRTKVESNGNSNHNLSSCHWGWGKEVYQEWSFVWGPVVPRTG